VEEAAQGQAATAEKAAREKAALAAAGKGATLNNLKAPVKERKKTKEKASTNKWRGRAVGANNKRKKLIQGATEEQIKRKQPGRPVGTEHCWSCGDDVLEAQYSHEKQCCSDGNDCKRRKDDKDPQVLVRARKKSTRYAEYA